MRALLISMVLLVPSLGRGTETIALLPATGANVSPGELAAATDVLRAKLERTGKFTVILVGTPAEERETTAAEAVRAAREAGAPVAATLRVSRLGAVGLVRFAAYRDGAGALPAHVDELPAKGVDDLEPALERIAVGFALGRPARSTAEIDTVTEREADPRLYKQRTAARMFGVRLESSFVVDRAGGGTGALSGLGLAWQYDARSFIADVGLDAQWSQTLDLAYRGHRDWLFGLGIGVYYPFSRGDAVPYVGAGASYVWENLGGDGAHGLALRGGLGLILGRLSTVQVRVDAGYQVNTFTESDALGQSHRGHGPYLSFGVVL